MNRHGRQAERFCVQARNASPTPEDAEDEKERVLFRVRQRDFHQEEHRECDAEKNAVMHLATGMRD